MADPIKMFVSIAPTYMGLFMADFDASLEDAAAVFGNLGHESAGFTKLQEINPTVPGSAGGWGWAQWTGPRRRAFEAYCERHGYDKSSPEANYKWLFNELNTTEKGALPKLKVARTLRDKVIAFENAYERAGIKHYDSRVEWAERALAAYKAAPTLPDDPTPTVPDPTGPDMGEILDDFCERNGLQEVAIVHRRKE